MERKWVPASKIFDVPDQGDPVPLVLAPGVKVSDDVVCGDCNRTPAPSKAEVPCGYCGKTGNRRLTEAARRKAGLPSLIPRQKKAEVAVAERLPDPEPDKAVARVTDPMTSWMAAASVTNFHVVRDAILAVLRVHGPQTDEEVYARLQDLIEHKRMASVSESGARTRRSELVKAGLVEDSGEKKKTKANRQTIVWRAVDFGGGGAGVSEVRVEGAGREEAGRDADRPGREAGAAVDDRTGVDEVGPDFGQTHLRFD